MPSGRTGLSGVATTGVDAGDATAAGAGGATATVESLTGVAAADHRARSFLRLGRSRRVAAMERHRANRPNRAEDEKDRGERATAKQQASAAFLGRHPRLVTAVQTNLRAGALLVRAGFCGRAGCGGCAAPLSVSWCN